MNTVIPLKKKFPPYMEEIEKKDGSTYIKVYPYRLAEYILGQENIYHTTLSKNSALFMYYSNEEGIWKLDTIEYLKKKITALLGEHSNINRVRETIEHIKNLTYSSGGEDVFDKKAYSLTLANGTYYFKNKGKEEGYFIPKWDPFDYSTTKVNIRYNQDMKDNNDIMPPLKSYEFLSNILDYEEINFIFEWIGFSLIKDYPLQKLLILQGPGGNGKSTLINFISGVLDERNISNLSLDTIQNERFARIQLKGKLMNSFADINDSYFNSMDIIKSITGDDYIYGEYKGQDGIMFKNFAKLIFSANALPAFKDKSEGLMRRLILLPMTKKPKGSGGISLESILNDKEELTKILLHAIKSIEGVLKRGEFSITENMEAALKNWFENQDNVSLFVKENCELKADSRTSIKKLFDDYKYFCMDNNYKAIGKQSFTDRLISRYELDKRKDGKLGHYLLGIQLVD